MQAGVETFLPRIRCVFYATFDHEQGPKVVYQVPENSIITPASVISSPTTSTFHHGGTRSRARTSRTTPGLFEFETISQYVIPKDPLCGSLVRVNTPSHRIIGYPVKLSGARYARYHRNSFRYNVCLVFDRTADLSCYEPVVRKIGRVLLACEQESSLLSSPNSTPRIAAILEQLFEDLNSYAETSIPIDLFNSIEIQLFPFYPNPKRVESWEVPVSLINLEKRRDPNWDLAMSKITVHIDGVNHVQRISDLADVSIELTRHCIEHLLFYQCIIMIDIFQYSNMYTLKSNFQWLAEEISVQEECAEFVTRPGYVPAPLSTLLHLYSSLKPGKTLHTFLEEPHHLPTSSSSSTSSSPSSSLTIEEMGIDPRRFVTFGIIKGFLRRVHRWPVLLARDRTLVREKLSASMVGVGDAVSGGVSPRLTMAGNTMNGIGMGHSPGQGGMPGGAGGGRTRSESITTTSSRFNTATNPSSSSTNIQQPQPSNAPLAAHLLASRPPPTNPRPHPGPHPPPLVSRTSSFAPQNQPSSSQPDILAQLPALLDGSHHTDELCVLFRVGWKELERMLVEVGEGSWEGAGAEDVGGGGGKIGRVRIIYR